MERPPRDGWPADAKDDAEKEEPSGARRRRRGPEGQCARWLTPPGLGRQEVSGQTDLLVDRLLERSWGGEAWSAAEAVRGYSCEVTDATTTDDEWKGLRMAGGPWTRRLRASGWSGRTLPRGTARLLL